MDLSGFNTHSFIVKLWLEETVEEAGQVTWRGHITHVPSGERRYVEDLNGITAFIMPRLQDMGVKTGGWWRVSDCLRWLRACLRLLLTGWLRSAP